MEVRKVKIFPNGFDLIIDGEKEHINNILELWDALGWDIENDKNASECASIVTRELYCFGDVDLSPLTGGEHSVKIEVCFENGGRENV